MERFHHKIKHGLEQGGTKRGKKQSFNNNKKTKKRPPVRLRCGPAAEAAGPVGGDGAVEINT